MVRQLDNNQYSDNDLVEVKMALNLPYITSWADYERVDGEIELGGTYYNYVKRKVSNDTLYLMCLPNKSKTQLYLSRNDYAKQANDIPSCEKNGKSSVKKIIISNEYNRSITGYSLIFPAVSMKIRTYRFASRLVNTFIGDKYQPPKANSDNFFL